MNKTDKIYVAGHTGMVGSSIVRKLESEGYTNLLLKTRKELDLLNQEAVSSFFQKEKPAYVILSAARVGGIQANRTYPADFLYENLQIQNNIIWSALHNDAKKLLFLGSSCIYPRDSKQPMKEEYFMEGKVEPTNEGYAIAKTAGLELCQMISKQFGKPFISCMPTNIYGEHDSYDETASHVIPGLISRFHNAKVNTLPEVVIWGTGNSKREFLYVDDLADACYYLMQHYDEEGFMNIGTGKDIAIKELAEIVRSVVGYTGKIVFDTTKPDGMPRKLLDVTKITDHGWKYTTSLAEGLEKTYKFFLKETVSSE